MQPERQPMSALGQKRTFRPSVAMSALPLKADIAGCREDVGGAIASRACASIRSLTTADGGFQPMTADRTVIDLDGTDFQKSRAFSPAVVTQGGKIVWLGKQPSPVWTENRSRTISRLRPGPASPSSTGRSIAWAASLPISSLWRSQSTIRDTATDSSKSDMKCFLTGNFHAVR